MIDDFLEPLEGNFSLLRRNPVEGWYEIEIAIPTQWVYNENNEISCDVVVEDNEGKLLRISPKKNSVLVDDLFKFVFALIEINKKIAEREKQFSLKMEEMKKSLEQEAKTFYEELEILKEDSFKKINDTYVKSQDGTKKRTRKKVAQPEKIDIDNNNE